LSITTYAAPPRPCGQAGHTLAREDAGAPSVGLHIAPERRRSTSTVTEEFKPRER
jgi:hypothetical protein